MTRTLFDFFLKVSRDPWWGPSGPMAEDRRRPWLSSAPAGAVRFSPERTSSVKRQIHRREGKIFGKSMHPRARAGRVRPGVSYDKDAPASSLPNSAAMTSQLQRLPRKHRVVPVECANPDCRARYVAVLTADPPDWIPHCIECSTPLGTGRGRAVYSLFAVID